MVKHIAFSLLLFALVLSPACNPKNIPITADWKPVLLPAFKAQESPDRPDESVMADMVTSVLLNNQATQQFGQVYAVISNTIPIHPQFGPFLFSSGNALIVVADSESRFTNWSGSLSSGQYTEAWFIALLPNPGSEQILLSNEIKKIKLPIYQGSSTLAQNGRIILTPEKMAAALSRFSQWEGVHFDKKRGELTFVGSNTVSNPQISAGDLITAYRAIYEHEALGQPLFVDMDFNEKRDNYLVTFGGGFEDTRPGRVLYEADLLLKALSSGIDPWSDEKPLVDVMCRGINQTPVQRIYCKYLWRYWDKKKKDPEIDKLIDEYYEKKSIAEDLAEMAYFGKAPLGWKYLLNADNVALKEIAKEVDSKGYFVRPDGGCSCNTKENITNLLNCDTECDKKNTLKWVNDVGKLSSDEKSIIEDANRLYPPPAEVVSPSYSVLPKFNLFRILKDEDTDEAEDTNKENRRDFTILAFYSDEIHDLLRKTSESNRVKIFKLMRNLDGRYGKNIQGSLRAKIALLLFMAKQEGFFKDLVALNEENQLLVVFIASTILDPKFANMLDNLQFHQPLCTEEQSDTRNTKIRDFNTAYSSFVCNYLSRYKRPYLAEQIRHYFDGYQSAAEIGGRNRLPIDDKMITVRYWFFPGNEVLTLGGPDQLNTFLFNRPNMKAQAERMGRRKGPFEDVDYSLDVPGIKENLQLINDHYDDLAEIFPTLKELNNLVRMLAFFRWIRYYQNDVFDLEAFANATDLGTPTPRTYPVYETVVALPDGSLMRSVGGVDLHSATQVGFDQEKINGFVSAMNSAGKGASFKLGEKMYVIAPAIKYSESKNTLEQIQTIAQGNRQIKVINTGAFSRIEHNSDSKLDWSLTSYPSPFTGDEYVFNNYSQALSERIVWAQNDTVANQFTFNTNSATVNLHKKSVGSILFHQQLKNKLTELGAVNTPSEILWALFTIPFKDAKMTTGSQEHLYQFKIDSVHVVRWLGKNNTTGQYVLNEISENEAQAWRMHLQGNMSTGKPGSTKVLGIQLTSTVPIDSLIISDLGYRNDSLLQVEIWDSHRSTKNMFDWRRVTADDTVVAPWDKDKQSNIILAPCIFDRGKGQFSNQNLTNRAFLIETVANLRSKSWKSASGKKHFAFLQEYPSDSPVWQSSEEPWRVYGRRLFVVDTLGFNPESRESLLRLVVEYPDRVFVFPGETPVLLKNDQPSEIVWLSGLTENEIRNRLGIAQIDGWLGAAQRIRVFNVNNPVFDLGNNLFIEMPRLRSVGAWPRVLNFESLLPLFEKLVQAPVLKELDAQIAELIFSIQREYQAKPSPQLLRIARDLGEALSSWEEIRQLNQYNLNWKNY